MLEIKSYSFALKYNLNIKVSDPPLVRLPIEVIREILSRLDIKDISACSLVCKNFYFIRTDDNLWNKLYARDFPFHSLINNSKLFYTNYKNSHLIKSNLINGRCSLTPFPTSLVNISTKFVSDGKIFLGSLKGEIEVTFIKTDERILLSGRDKKVSSLVTFNGELISGYADGKIGFWNLENGECILVEGHSDEVTSLIVSGELLFSGSSDHTIKVWDPSTRKHLRTLTGHAEAIQCIADLGGKIFSSDVLGIVKVWDGNNTNAECLSFSSRSSFAVFNGQLFLPSDGIIEIYDPNTGDYLGRFKGGHPSKITSLFIIEELLFSCCSAYTIIWDLKTREPVKVRNSFKPCEGNYGWAPFIVQGEVLLPGQLYLADGKAWSLHLGEGYVQIFDFTASHDKIYEEIIALLSKKFFYSILTDSHREGLGRLANMPHEISSCSRYGWEVYSEARVKEIIQEIKVFLSRFAK